MNITDLIHRNPISETDDKLEKIPWNEPGFSRRMLREHLSQEHDLASRRLDKIHHQVNWINQEVLSGKSSTILDLGCGPGLYTVRLARLGHSCTGLDFSPASIEYAVEQAKQENLPIIYRLEDLRSADFGSGFLLAMFLFGEFNVFSPEDALGILKRCYSTLLPGGSLLLEVHHLEVVHQIGFQPSTWYTTLSGLFSDEPYLCLKECFWDQGLSRSIEHYYVIDSQSGQVNRYGSFIQAYSRNQYGAILNEAGFLHLEFYPSLLGEPDPSQPDFFVIRAQKE